MAVQPIPNTCVNDPALRFDHANTSTAITQVKKRKTLSLKKKKQLDDTSSQYTSANINEVSKLDLPTLEGIMCTFVIIRLCLSSFQNLVMKSCLFLLMELIHRVSNNCGRVMTVG